MTVITKQILPVLYGLQWASHIDGSLWATFDSDEEANYLRQIIAYLNILAQQIETKPIESIYEGKKGHEHKSR